MDERAFGDELHKDRANLIGGMPVPDIGLHLSRYEIGKSGWFSVVTENAGKVALSKVNFNAKFEWEYIKNLKVLQEAFLKLGIEKVSFRSEVFFFFFDWAPDGRHSEIVQV